MTWYECFACTFAERERERKRERERERGRGEGGIPRNGAVNSNVACLQNSSVLSKQPETAASTWIGLQTNKYTRACERRRASGFSIAQDEP